MKNIIYMVFVLTGFILVNCGNPDINISEVNYEPKISVEAYLYPEEPVSKIKLTRNFQLEKPIDKNDLILTPGKNNLVAKINGTELFYDEQTGTYFNDNLIPDYNKSYVLEVTAVIDGKELFTRSRTITPLKGFRLLEHDLGTLKYLTDKPTINFMPSPGTDFYAFSIRAENATLDNFIYDNPYIPNIKRKDLEENFGDFNLQMNLILNVNSYTENKISYDISALDTWFYTNYKVVVYAGDENFKDYVLTVNNVQEGDGNFVEPEFHFEGDGIGIFGSAIKSELVFILSE